MTDPTEQAILDLLEFIEAKFQHRKYQDITIRKAPSEWHVIVPNYEYKLCLGFGKGATVLEALKNTLTARINHLKWLKSWIAEREAKNARHD